MLGPVASPVTFVGSKRYSENLMSLIDEMPRVDAVLITHDHIDLTLMEGGQYDRRWSWVHMTPEQSVQAHMDVKGKTMMLVHWGAFTLAYHGWTEPIERALKQAAKKNVPLIAPKIGEIVPLQRDTTVPISNWWK